MSSFESALNVVGGIDYSFLIPSLSLLWHTPLIHAKNPNQVIKMISMGSISLSWQAALYQPPPQPRSLRSSVVEATGRRRRRDDNGDVHVPRKRKTKTKQLWVCTFYSLFGPAHSMECKLGKENYRTGTYRWLELHSQWELLSSWTKNEQGKHCCCAPHRFRSYLFLLHPYQFVASRISKQSSFINTSEPIVVQHGWVLVWIFVSGGIVSLLEPVHLFCSVHECINPSSFREVEREVHGTGITTDTVVCALRHLVSSITLLKSPRSQQCAKFICDITSIATPPRHFLPLC